VSVAKKRATRNVAVIGLGIMGSAMSANLVRAGFAVTGYDVVAGRRSALSRGGGRAAASIAAAVRDAPFIITSLPSGEALLEVAAAIAGVGRARQVVIETSTLPIDVKEEARAILVRSGVTLIDCPLSGTGAQAKTRDLCVYASGPRGACRKCIPVFDGFARAHFYLGDFGAGSRMKFLANLLVAIHNVSSAEALVLAQKAGIDRALAVRVLSDGAGSSRMLQVRGPMMARGKYKPATMKVGTWQKDMRIIGEFARSLDTATPLFDATAAIYDAAMAQGLAEADTASVFAVIQRLSKGK
jgi:3-hydroxyisobutyrate dehydrogenase-like beta-hydroxyacid dehydrogenase